MVAQTNVLSRQVAGNFGWNVNGKTNFWRKRDFSMILNSKTRTKDCSKVFGTGNFLISLSGFLSALSNFPIVDNLMRLMERFVCSFVVFCKVQIAYLT